MSPLAEQLAMLRTLIAEGLTFGACVNAFAARTAVERAYVTAAQDHQREGELEIDSNAVVSMGDDQGGAYVMAWIWVADSEIWKGEVDTDGEPCLFINHYHHCCPDVEAAEDHPTWIMAYSCACNDACPNCGAEIEPYKTIELDITGKPTNSEG